MRRTEVWTDGSCLLRVHVDPNPYRKGVKRAIDATGPGGWAWVTRDGRYASGFVDGTTNNRMEALAVLQAIKTIGDEPLVVISDSRYVVDMFNKRWYERWMKQHWRNAQGKPVKNQDILKPLIEEALKGDVLFQWVKGHSGNEMNHEADRLCGRARKDREGTWNLTRKEHQ